MLSKLESIRQELEQMTTEEVLELVKPHLPSSTPTELLFLTCYEGGDSCTFGVFESIDKAKQYLQKTRIITGIEERNNSWGWFYYIYVEPKEDEYEAPFYSLTKTVLNLEV